VLTFEVERGEGGRKRKGREVKGREERDEIEFEQVPFPFDLNGPVNKAFKFLSILHISSNCRYYCILGLQDGRRRRRRMVSRRGLFSRSRWTDFQEEQSSSL